MTLLRANIDSIHARRIVVDRLRRAAHDPAFHQPAVQRQRMKPVRTGLLARNLQVARQHETLPRAKPLNAIVAAAEPPVELEFGVALNSSEDHQDAVYSHDRISYGGDRSNN